MIISPQASQNKTSGSPWRKLPSCVGLNHTSHTSCCRHFLAGVLLRSDLELPARQSILCWFLRRCSWIELDKHGKLPDLPALISHSQNARHPPAHSALVEVCVKHLLDQSATPLCTSHHVQHEGHFLLWSHASGVLFFPQRSPLCLIFSEQCGRLDCRLSARGVWHRSDQSQFRSHNQQPQRTLDSPIMLKPSSFRPPTLCVHV